MKAILVVGMPGSGKEEFARRAANAKIPVVRMGDVVRDEATKNGMVLSDVNVGSFAQSEREKHGPGIWAERTIRRMTASLTVIDGIRSHDEVNTFRNALGKDIAVVGIYASAGTRFKRLTTRRRKDAPLTTEAFDMRDQRELGWGLGMVFALCDFLLPNEGTLEELRGASDELIQQLRK